MMLTTFDIVNILYNQLTQSGVQGAITGVIRKYERPFNSDKEDIIINCLPSPNSQLQKTVANVNIHVPALDVTENGQGYKAPDSKRLKELTDVVLAALMDQWGDTYNYDIQQQGLMQDSDNSFYNNIRINFFNLN